MLRNDCCYCLSKRDDQSVGTTIDDVTMQDLPEIWSAVTNQPDNGSGIVIQRGEDGLLFVGPRRGKIL